MAVAVAIGSLMTRVRPAEAALPGVNGRVVYAYSGNDNEIYKMYPDGSNQKNLTNNPADDFSLAASPDGKKIAFYSDRKGNNEICVMSSDAWRPDLSVIMFVAGAIRGSVWCYSETGA